MIAAAVASFLTGSAGVLVGSLIRPALMHWFVHRDVRRLARGGGHVLCHVCGRWFSSDQGWAKGRPV